MPSCLRFAVWRHPPPISKRPVSWRHYDVSSKLLSAGMRGRQRKVLSWGRYRWAWGRRQVIVSCQHTTTHRPHRPTQPHRDRQTHKRRQDIRSLIFFSVFGEEQQIPFFRQLIVDQGSVCIYLFALYRTWAVLFLSLYRYSSNYFPLHYLYIFFLDLLSFFRTN